MSRNRRKNYAHTLPNHGVAGFKAPAKKTVPTKTKDLTHLSVVLFNQTMLDDFYKECEPFAKASEFQVHYRGLVVRIKNDKSNFSVVIPTAMYNFKQEVSHSAVSWDGSDATKRAEEAIEASAKKVKQLLEDMPILNKLATAYGGEILESDCGTLHRHPGDFSFSGTDYDMDPDEPGVVFRKRKAKDFLQNDSVMYFGYNNRNKIVCNETRVVNVEETTDGGVKGEYCEVPTYCFVLKRDESKNDNLETLLGSKEHSVDVYDSFNGTTSFDKVQRYQILTQILTEYLASNYEPDIDLVEGKLIEGRSYGIKSTTSVNNNLKDSPRGNYYNQNYYEYQSDFGEEWEEYYGRDEGGTVFVSDEPSTEIIAGKECVYDEKEMIWVPTSRQLTDEELIEEYIKNNNTRGIQ